MALGTDYDWLVRFTVKVSEPFNDLLDDIAAVYVTGDHPSFGDWNPTAAVRMKKVEDDESNESSSVWTLNVNVPRDNGHTVGVLQYRYFIGCARYVDSHIVHVLKWESAAKPRVMRLQDSGGQSNFDEFGLIDGKITAIDGWLGDPQLAEIRFALFNKQAINFTHPNYANCKSYNVSMQALSRERGKDELTVDKSSAISSAVINDEKRRAYRVHSGIPSSCSEVYAADGSSLISFRVQTANAIENVRFQFFVSNGGGGAESFVAVADAEALSRSLTQGKIETSLVDLVHGTVVGKICVAYFIALASTPPVVKFSTMKTSFVNYWTSRPSLDIGHRGMGKSYTHMASERENTIKSMVTAFNKGADYVEFDVQLTKDQVPVLFHDFHMCLEIDKDDLREVEFHNLTLEQLSTLNIRHHVDLKTPEKKSMLPVVDRKSEQEDPTCRAFPTLKEVLESAPAHLGFNIEVKYPMDLEGGTFECGKGILEPNLFVDRVLEVLVEHAKQRRIVFSSFCPEICTLLKLKQNRYPTFFLTQGITNRYVSYANPLTKTSENAIAFALTEGLLGVCFHSEDVMRRPELIKDARSNGLVSFVWGNDLDELTNIAYVKGLGADAVIYDRIDEHIKGKQNVFQISKEC